MKFTTASAITTVEIDGIAYQMQRLPTVGAKLGIRSSARIEPKGLGWRVHDANDREVTWIRPVPGG